MLRSADCAGAHGVRCDGAEQAGSATEVDFPAVRSSLREHAQMRIPSPCAWAEGMVRAEALG